MTKKTTPHQLHALALVAQGHVEYGAEYPNMARRAAAANPSRLIQNAFIVNANQRQVPRPSTWESIEERGWITVRHDLVPTHTVDECIQTYNTLNGTTTKTIPAHTEPIDPGWRTRVELTDAGREILGHKPSDGTAGG